MASANAMRQQTIIERAGSKLPSAYRQHPQGVQASLKVATRLLRAPDRLQRELLVLQWQVVLQFIQREARPAAAAHIRHLQHASSPDALDVLDIRVRQAANELVFRIVLDPGESVVVLADPDQRT